MTPQLSEAERRELTVLLERVNRLDQQLKETERRLRAHLAKCPNAGTIEAEVWGDQ